MPELPPEEFNEQSEQMNKKSEFIALALEIMESQETFPFSGIKPEIYSQMKIDEVEYPGYTTPIDELIVRFQNEGMKVILGKDPSSGNIYILPANSANIEEDSVQPRQLEISETMDEKLKQLILSNSK